MRKWKKAQILVEKRHVVELPITRGACYVPGIMMVTDLRWLEKSFQISNSASDDIIWN